MNNSIFKSIYFLIILLFLIFIFIIYFSEENINRITENRYKRSNQINNSPTDLPILKNNTENIIEYSQMASVWQLTKIK